jgi:hypothetical protein
MWNTGRFSSAIHLPKNVPFSSSTALEVHDWHITSVVGFTMGIKEFSLF